MDLALFTEEFRPSKKGGIATWAQALANQFGKDENIRITVFVKKRGGCDDFSIHDNAPYRIIPMGGRDWPKFKKWYTAFYLWKYLKDYQNPMVLMATWELAEGAVLLKKKYPHTLITAAHGLEVTRLNWAKYRSRKNRFQKTIINSNAVVSVSKFTHDEIVKLLGNSKKELSIIPNGVDIPREKTHKETISINQIEVSAQKPFILSLARLKERKGQDTVIKALPKILSSFPDVLYVIAGDGDHKWNRKLKDDAKDLGVEKSVKFLGYVSEAEKWWLYHHCKIYIMVSKNAGKKGDSEGFGITFLESNICGKPVIGSRTGGISEAVEEGKNGLLVAPDNPEETGDAVIKLMSNKSIYDEMSVYGKNRTLNHFTWPKIAHRYKNLLQEVSSSL